MVRVVSPAPRGFLGATQFLTRIPIRLAAPVEHAKIVPWFGIVGVLIGAAVGGVGAGLGVLVPTTVAAACAVVVGLIITGAFHEDGLADIADAFGGGWTVEQRLEILKDSRHGTYGVAALTASIVIRIVAASAIAGSAALFASFVAAHAIGRSAAVVAMKTAPPARSSGLGVSAAADLRMPSVVLGSAAGLGLAALAVGWWVVPFVGAAAAGTGVVVVLAVRKIGGLAGDVLGAVEQIVESLVLVVASGLAAHHDLWWR
jgi:adenosylcobinamide-GDP ribazoletransferase